MYVLIISRGYPTKQDAQWGSFEKDQAEALQALGHKVVIASVDGRFRLYHRPLGLSIQTAQNCPSFNYFLCPDKCYSFLGVKLFLKVKQHLLWKVYEAVKEKYGRPDVIYAHYFTNIALSQVIKAREGIPILGLEHASVLNVDQLERHPFTYHLAQYAYKHSDKLLAVSEKLAQRMQGYFGTKASVVYDMVGPEFIEAGGRLLEKQTLETSVLPVPFTYIAMGSLLPRKRFKNLILAFSLLHDAQSKLLIIGGGKLKAPLHALIQELELQHQVFLLGKLRKEELLEYLKNSQVLVSSSCNETFGVTLIEGMALGLPVVATKSGGPDEFIHAENGLLVEVDDVEDLRKNLRTIKDNYLDYDRKKIALRCAEQFSPHSIIAQVEQYLKETIAQ